MNEDDFTRWGEKMNKAGDTMIGAGFALALVVFVVFALLVLFL